MTNPPAPPIPLAARPVLFLDVDGPLIPFGSARSYPAYESPGAPAGADGHPLLSRLDPALGPRLAALPCELVWATTWMDDANACVAPRLGLPDLPVADWPEPSAGDLRSGTHWKTAGLVAWAAGRAFAWVDDEIGDADRRWVSAHHPGPALLHRVDPQVGLGERDFAALDIWLRAHTS
ncbi:HAD domain-containing protein [Streptomyces sp. NBC_00335]|uniref:HAD domain-containing protein n=1 Tax=unclassified Streptomyces TaxID=2593676 RepID=UPI002258D523|nr:MULTISPECIES: HAD domain-containing protein [unclassified Streptomyces]MCX5402724.1 HAD domain-containing protein [Streptomyces sp. NBC_00086]